MPNLIGRLIGYLNSHSPVGIEELKVKFAALLKAKFAVQQHNNLPDSPIVSEERKTKMGGVLFHI